MNTGTSMLASGLQVLFDAKCLHQLTALNVKGNELEANGATIINRLLLENSLLAFLNLRSMHDSPPPPFFNLFEVFMFLCLSKRKRKNPKYNHPMLYFVIFSVPYRLGFSVVSPGNRLRRSGVYELSEGVAKSSALLVLNMQQNDLGDLGFVAFARRGLQENSSLLQLNICGRWFFTLMISISSILHFTWSVFYILLYRDYFRVCFSIDNDLGPQSAQALVDVLSDNICQIKILNIESSLRTSSSLYLFFGFAVYFFFLYVYLQGIVEFERYHYVQIFKISREICSTLFLFWWRFFSLSFFAWSAFCSKENHLGEQGGKYLATALEGNISLDSIFLGGIFSSHSLTCCKDEIICLMRRSIMSMED